MKSDKLYVYIYREKEVTKKSNNNIMNLINLYGYFIYEF